MSAEQDQTKNHGAYILIGLVLLPLHMVIRPMVVATLWNDYGPQAYPVAPTAVFSAWMVTEMVVSNFKRTTRKNQDVKKAVDGLLGDIMMAAIVMGCARLVAWMWP